MSHQQLGRSAQASGSLSSAVRFLGDAWKEVLNAPVDSNTGRRKGVLITGSVGMGKTATIQAFYNMVFSDGTSWEQYPFGAFQPTFIGKILDSSLIELDSNRRRLWPPGLTPAGLRLRRSDPVWLPLRCIPDVGEFESGQLKALIRQVHDLGPRPPRWRLWVSRLFLVAAVGGFATGPVWLGLVLAAIGLAGVLVFEPLPLLERVRSAFLTNSRTFLARLHRLVSRLASWLGLKRAVPTELERALTDRLRQVLKLLDRSGKRADVPICLIVDDAHLAQKEVVLLLQYVLDFFPDGHDGVGPHVDLQLRQHSRNIEHPILVIISSSDGTLGGLEFELTEPTTCLPTETIGEFSLEGLTSDQAKQLYLEAFPELDDSDLASQILRSTSMATAYGDDAPVPIDASLEEILRELKARGVGRR